MKVIKRAKEFFHTKPSKDSKLVVEKPNNNEVVDKNIELTTELEKVKKDEKFYREEYQKSQDELRLLQKENKRLKQQVVESLEGKVALNVINMLQELFTDRRIDMLLQMQNENRENLKKIVEIQQGKIN